MSKKLSAQEQMLKLAKSLGIELPGLEQLDESRREADTLTLYLENPSKFRETHCRECRQQFATSYSSVAMCSDKCRIAHLARIGIVWSPEKSQSERWDGRIPLVCGAEALTLAKLALAQSV